MKNRHSPIKLINGIEVRAIPGFPDYAVSREGKVWSFPKRCGYNGNGSHQGKWLRPAISHKLGYLRFGLTDSLGKQYNRSIHRLVLEAWVGPCPERMECRHLNGNKQDNRVENLKWGTSSENGKDKITHGTTAKGERHGRVKLTEREVRMIVYMWRTGEFTQRGIAKIYAVGTSIIHQIVNRQSWQHIYTK